MVWLKSGFESSLSPGVQLGLKESYKDVGFKITITIRTAQCSITSIISFDLSLVMKAL